MTGARRLFLDTAPGERRGVVTLDGRPERLLIARDGEGGARLGERWRARLGGRGPGGGRWLELGEGPPGWIAEPSALAEGAAVEVEVVSEARADKGPRLRVLGSADGPPLRLALAPDLRARLQGFAPDTAVEEGPDAEAAADLAQEAALAVRHALGGSLSVSVEPTRALTAVDVDLAASGGARVVQEANLRAIRHAVRLLRLKGLGGLAVIDLVGAKPAAGLMRAEAARALAPDGPDARVQPPDGFGLLALARPHRETPAAERLLGPDGRPTARTLAQARVRDLRRELHARPGARLALRCPPDVAEAIAPLLPALGPRVEVAAALAAPREGADIAER